MSCTESLQRISMHTYEVSQAIFLDDLLTNVSANGSSLQWHAGHCQSPKTFSVQIWAERSEKEHVSTIHRILKEMWKTWWLST